jgi:hypothetical protein
MALVANAFDQFAPVMGQNLGLDGGHDIRAAEIDFSGRRAGVSIPMAIPMLRVVRHNAGSLARLGRVQSLYLKQRVSDAAGRGAGGARNERRCLAAREAGISDAAGCHPAGGRPGERLAWQARGGPGRAALLRRLIFSGFVGYSFT